MPIRVVTRRLVATNPENRILVTGNPRSGNVWLARLLADALDCSVVPYKLRPSLATMPNQNESWRQIFQMHLFPTYEGDYDEFFATYREAFIPRWSGEKVIHIYRDPRDIAISVMHYWKLDSIGEAVTRMENDIGNIPRWDRFVSAWLDVKDIPVMNVSYEDLSSNTEGTVVKLLEFIGAETPIDLSVIVERQSFANKKKEVEFNGNPAQIEHMRNGKVGEWKTKLSSSDIISIEKRFGKVMKRMEYI